METPAAIRVAAIFCLLAIGGVWYAQSHYLNLAIIHKFASQRAGWGLVFHAEFASHGKQAADDAAATDGERPASELKF